MDLRKPTVQSTSLETTPTNAELGAVDDNVQVGNLVDVTPTVKQNKVLKSYRMIQKRRMRSGHTYYLDHPLMGMIIQVRRVN